MSKIKSDLYKMSAEKIAHDLNKPEIEFADKNRLDLENIMALFLTAPMREFANGYKAQGYFQSELIKMSIQKRHLRKLVKKKKLNIGYVTMKKGGDMIFYSLKMQATMDLNK